jgi:hypothetical protein
MPTILIHGIGHHDLTQFRTFFLHVRDRLRASVARCQAHSLPETAFFPVYWGDWGPQAWYRGISLPPGIAPSPAAQPDELHLAGGVQAKSLDSSAHATFDPGLDALQVVLSTPGPLQEVLDDLGISAAELTHAVMQTKGPQRRSRAVVTRLLVRARLRHDRTPQKIIERLESRATLQALLALILDQPQALPKGLPAVVAYPFWATVTALARHLRGSIMEVATNFVGDVMLYLARGAEVRQSVHSTVLQASMLRPNEPLVLIGHSLGGVIAYEYSTDPIFSDRPPIDLLVTVGSQVGLFAEYGLLQVVGPPLEGGKTSAQQADRRGGLQGPWLNFYDPDDFLSFPIGRVFREAADGDRICPAGQPFPASHGAYWNNEELYTAIAKAYPIQL